MSNQLIETYQGICIHHEAGEGFHASAGAAVHCGYCDTVAEIRAEIDDHFAEDAAHYAPIAVRDDTPSIGSPWWHQR